MSTAIPTAQFGPRGSRRGVGLGFVLFVITSMALAVLQARPRGSVMSGSPAAPTAPVKK